jgi:hypothetical protein
MISYPFSDLLASRFQDDRLEYQNSCAQLVIVTDYSEMGFRFHAKRLSLERDTASSPLRISLFWVSEKLAKIPIFAIAQEFAEVGEIGEERRVQGQGSIFGAH